jgi:uncharacterized protein
MTPCFQIINNSKDLAPSYAPYLIELSLTDSVTDHADEFSLTVSDVGNTLDLPVKGEQIDVRLGDGVTLPQIQRTYVIDSVEIQGPPDQIKITGAACPFANAGAMKAMQHQQSRSWDSITIGNLVSGIADEVGMTAVVSPDFASITIDHLDQTNESNMNLLTRVAADYGATFKPCNGKLFFSLIGNGKNADGQAIPALTITRGPGTKFQAAFSKRQNFTSAKVDCQDVATGKSYAANSEGGYDMEKLINMDGTPA